MTFLDPLGLQTDQHHNLPREHKKPLMKKCGDTFRELGYVLPKGIGSFIVGLTSPFLVNVHKHIGAKVPERFGWNEKVKSILDSDLDCCTALKMIDALIGQLNSYLVGVYWPGSTPLPRREMYPYSPNGNPWNRSPNPGIVKTNDVWRKVLRDVCGVPCPKPQPYPLPVTVPVRCPEFEYPELSPGCRVVIFGTGVAIVVCTLVEDVATCGA